MIRPTGSFTTFLEASRSSEPNLTDIFREILDLCKRMGLDADAQTLLTTANSILESHRKNKSIKK